MWRIRLTAKSSPPLCGSFMNCIDNVLTCSAAHNRGIWDLSCAIEDHLESHQGELIKTPFEDGATKIALLGRPNAGKSSILNRLCGENRSLVSDIAGTTRDTIDTLISFNKKPYVLLDTAEYDAGKNIR